jgi:hypothetical protein
MDPMSKALARRTHHSMRRRARDNPMSAVGAGIGINAAAGGAGAIVGAAASSWSGAGAWSGFQTGLGYATLGGLIVGGLSTRARDVGFATMGIGFIGILVTTVINYFTTPAPAAAATS